MSRGSDPSLRTTLAGIPLAAPLLLAAGTAGVLDETADAMDLSQIGGVVTKSITPKPREGNPPPRITWTRTGMLNAIGLANPGLVRFKVDHLPRAAMMPCAVFASVAGFRVEDYANVAGAIDGSPGVRAIELNVSCPNVHGGTEFGADPGALRELLAAVRPVVRTSRLFVKLSPITVGTPHSVVDLASVAIGRGADGLTLTNTIPAMKIDIDSRRPVLSNITGGLSGPAVQEIVLKLVHDVYRGVARDARVPIIACGGISSWRDAAAYTLAGATAFQMGAATMADLRAPKKVLRGLSKWVRTQGVERCDELVGALKLG